MNGLELVFDGNLDLNENKESLEKNAIEKARSALKEREEFEYSLGDDSGVFVDALDGFPGVHSRRWFGDPKNDSGRNQEILRLLDSEENRNAHLITAFALAKREKEEVVIVDNLFYISFEEKGKHGFGYDAILIPSEQLVLDSKARGISDERIKELINNKITVAELTQEEKNAVNNRGRIAKQIKELIENEKIYGAGSTSA